MLPMVVTLIFVLAALAFAAYALVRPFTHTHYHHDGGEKLFKPLP